jgi:uncharacterized surface protein with fasciclin (FAS1) repeats
MRLSRLLATVSLTAALPFAVWAQTGVPAAAPPAAVALPAGPHLVARGDLIATLKASPDFTVLAKALDATNMSATLASTPDLTLFAPTDQAFHALPAAQLTALLDPKNLPLLQQVLTYHLVHLDLDSAKFKGARGPVETVERGNLQVDGSGPVLKVNDAQIIQSDVRASNGIIQVVDKVLIPADVHLPAASAEAGGGAAVGR